MRGKFEIDAGGQGGSALDNFDAGDIAAVTAMTPVN